MSQTVYFDNPASITQLQGQVGAIPGQIITNSVTADSVVITKPLDNFSMPPPTGKYSVDCFQLYDTVDNIPQIRTWTGPTGPVFSDAYWLNVYVPNASRPSTTQFPHFVDTDVNQQNVTWAGTFSFYDHFLTFSSNIRVGSTGGIGGTGGNNIKSSEPFRQFMIQNYAPTAWNMTGIRNTTLFNNIKNYKSYCRKYVNTLDSNNYMTGTTYDSTILNAGYPSADLVKSPFVFIRSGMSLPSNTQSLLAVELASHGFIVVEFNPISSSAWCRDRTNTVAVPFRPTYPSDINSGYTNGTLNASCCIMANSNIDTSIVSWKNVCDVYLRKVVVTLQNALGGALASKIDFGNSGMYCQSYGGGFVSTAQDYQSLSNSPFVLKACIMSEPTIIAEDQAGSFAHNIKNANLWANMKSRFYMRLGENYFNQEYGYRNFTDNECIEQMIKNTSNDVVEDSFIEQNTIESHLNNSFYTVVSSATIGATQGVGGTINLPISDQGTIYPLDDISRESVYAGIPVDTYSLNIFVQLASIKTYSLFLRRNLKNLLNSNDNYYDISNTHILRAAGVGGNVDFAPRTYGGKYYDRLFIGTEAVLSSDVNKDITCTNKITVPQLSVSGSALPATDTTIAFKIPIVVNGTTYYVSLTSAQ